MPLIKVHLTGRSTGHATVIEMIKLFKQWPAAAAAMCTKICPFIKLLAFNTD
jgi:hypothetical protein